MTNKATYLVSFRRRREGKTNYKKRLALVKSGLPKLVVRKSNRYIVCQLIQFDPRGDKVLLHVNSKQLEKFGWKAPEHIDANTTNCLLNSLANRIHKARFNFHPYAFELAKLVREGYLARDTALEKIEESEDAHTIRLVKDKLGLT